MSPLFFKKLLPYFKGKACFMKVDLSTERKGQGHAFYQNEHNLVDEFGYFMWNFRTVVYSSFPSPSSLSQRGDHFVV